MIGGTRIFYQWPDSLPFEIYGMSVDDLTTMSGLRRTVQYPLASFLTYDEM